MALRLREGLRFRKIETLQSVDPERRQLSLPIQLNDCVLKHERLSLGRAGLRSQLQAARMI